MNKPIRIILIQPRTANDPMVRHELEAFAARSKLDLSAFTTFNIALKDRPELNLQVYEGAMVGSSGAFSLVEGGFDWHQDFLDLMRPLLRAKIPTFASCFG